LTPCDVSISTTVVTRAAAPGGVTRVIEEEADVLVTGLEPVAGNEVLVPSFGVPK
jgi:hypothetical protein